MSQVDVIFFAPGQAPEILCVEDSLEAWERLVGGPLGSYNSGHKDLGFMCLDVFKDSDTPCRVRSFDGHLVRGPFIVYRTREGVTVDATPRDLARARVSFRPVTCDYAQGQFSTLAELFAAMRCAVDREGVSAVQSANLQYLLEQVTRPFNSTPADLTHARAAAAAVGLSATIDRYTGLIVFRRLGLAAESTDYVRIGGSVVCETCGYFVSDHPAAIGAEFLTVLCDGRFVKV